jgi:hypothetical protein|nr:MAG TPA: NTP-PPase-like protein [Caudoviricetes sp.]
MTQTGIYNWDNIAPLARLAHNTAVAKGSWDERRHGRYHYDHYMMLVLAKLGKAVEADRVNKWARLSNKTIKKLERLEGEHYTQMFVNEVKYSVEYEIANACIRLLDFIGSMVKGEEVIEAFTLLPATSMETFTTQLLKATEWLSNPFQEQDTYKSNATRIVRILRTISKTFAFDLMKHVELQMKYNATRPALHGKKY